MTRAHKGLALLMLLGIGSARLARADGDRKHVGVVVVDIRPDAAVARWVARAVEQVVLQQIRGYRHIRLLDRSEIGVQHCATGKLHCALDAYCGRGVDIVVAGTVRSGALSYRVSQCWTRDQMASGVVQFTAGAGVMALKKDLLRVLAPLLRRDGALARKRSFEASQRVTSGQWFLALLGGIAWGWFILVTLRSAFPLVGGIGRIAHRDVLRLLKAWCVVCSQRLLLLAVVYAPLAWLLVGVIVRYRTHARLILTLVAPVVGLLSRYLWLAVVAWLAAYLDDRLVDGPATADNARHRDMRKYFQGYLNRTGWWLDDRLFDKILFLPGKTAQLVCYGGGVTHCRVVIPAWLVQFALGESEQPRIEAHSVPWTDGLDGTVAPEQGSLAVARSKRVGWGRRVLDVVGHCSHRLLMSLFVRPSVASSGAALGRKRALGQAATSLGYVVPFAPEEQVPLIANSTEDFEIVRQLLAEHFAWFEGDPEDISDDTDPTDKDFLFGVLVHAVGQIQRRSSQNTTLLCAVSLITGDSWLGVPFRLVGRGYQRWFCRSPTMLADGYAALNLARNHLMQYLYYVGWTRDDLLTSRADDLELHTVSKRILRRVGAIAEDALDRQHRRATARNRLVWLSQFYHAGLVVPSSRWLRTAALVIVVVAIALGASYWVTQAVEYHPVYVQRLAAQAKRAKESADKPHTTTGPQGAPRRQGE